MEDANVYKTEHKKDAGKKAEVAKIASPYAMTDEVSAGLIFAYLKTT